MNRLELAAVMSAAPGAPDGLDELLGLLQRPWWHAHAVCRRAPLSIFFPGRGRQRDAEDARLICGGCPVRVECLETALADPDTRGIWGGTSERERAVMRRKAAA